TIDQVLQGTAPGVQVSTASSEPGGALSVRIRGTSSITGNSEPLYVIDGFPIENDIEGSSVGNGGRTRTTPANPLVTLNPSDIESISILKDASATAIYAAPGALGFGPRESTPIGGTRSSARAACATCSSPCGARRAPPRQRDTPSPAVPMTRTASSSARACDGIRRASTSISRSDRARS